MPFNTNVFINCPFDPDYIVLLRPLIFTVIYVGLDPKISQTKSSSNIRINQIKDYIRDSKYGIHDISRSKAMKKGELPRFNMPYELGLDIGCSEFGNKKNITKKVLILDTEQYRYQKVLSDIAGQDISAHSNDPKTLVKKVRNWFSTLDDTNEYPGASEIWLAYNQFYDDLTLNLTANSYTANDIDEMPVADYIKFTKRWILEFKS